MYKRSYMKKETFHGKVHSKVCILNQTTSTFQEFFHIDTDSKDVCLKFVAPRPVTSFHKSDNMEIRWTHSEKTEFTSVSEAVAWPFAFCPDEILIAHF